MENQQLLWIAAIGTVVASTWRYIKIGWSTISSLVILQVDVDGILAHEILSHLWEEMYSQPLNPRKFTSWYIFVKSNQRSQMVAFETIGRSGIVFWSGWRPIWVTETSGGEKEEKKATDTPPDDKITIRYLRGTLAIESLITRLTKEHNRSTDDFQARAGRRSRFQVLRRIGSRGRNSQSDGAPSVISESGKEWADDVRTRRRRRPIGEDWDNLGESPDDDSPSPFDFLAYPGEVMETVDRISHWLENRTWYTDRHIPWRRGLELVGPPGSGKSSLIRAVGEHLGLPINVFDLASMTNEDFVKSWSESCRNTPCIIAIEDSDSVFDGRKNVTADSGNVMALSFDCVLNCVSGVVRSDGVVLFLTTNHPKKIDPALTRRGRIDEILYLDGIDEECRYRVARVVLNEHPDDIIHQVVEAGRDDQPAQFHDRCARVAEKMMWQGSSDAETNGQIIENILK